MAIESFKTADKRWLLEALLLLVHGAFCRLATICLLAVAGLLTQSTAISAADPLTELKSLADGFSRVYRTAAPSVVHVRSEIAPQDARVGEPTEAVKPSVSSGSGFVFSTPAASKRDHQFILTSNHVIDQAVRTTVRLADGREFNARITGRDPKTDIAVIEIPAAGLKPLPLADSDRILIGQWVLAIGNPFGLKHSLSVGVVSGTGRTNLGINAYEDYIQTDAAIGPGNSGGPLINLDGEILGIISSIFTDRHGPTGAGFAIPINLARTVANQLVTSGEVDRAYLGVFLQSLDASLARAFGTPDTRGALISEVAPGSPAEEAGLRVGDVIIQYRGQSVRDAGSFINDLSLTPPNSLVTMSILRDSEPQTLTATVRARRSYEQASIDSGQTSTINRLGMSLSAITQETAAQFSLSRAMSADAEGLIVTKVQPGSSAARGGIEPGNIVLQLNHQTVSDFDEFNRVIKANSDKSELLFLVKQGSNQQFIVLDQN